MVLYWLGEICVQDIILWTAVLSRPQKLTDSTVAKRCIFIPLSKKEIGKGKCAYSVTLSGIEFLLAEIIKPKVKSG